MWWPLAAAAAAVALGIVGYRGDAFWCSARGLPLGSFWRPYGFTYDQVPSLLGKVVLVTGANTGLGFEVAKQCVQAGATVVLACRDVAKGEQAARGIAEAAKVPPARLRVVHLDLADLRQVDRAASAILEQLDALHAVINNAGVATQFPQPALTVDGVERTFQANFLGHFHLTLRLLPLLERSAASSGVRSRVVHLTSGAHRAAPAEGVPLSLEGINDVSVGPFARYGMAKLASMAWSGELARRYPHAVLSNAVHPGVVATEMLRIDTFREMLGPLLGPLAWVAGRLRNRLLAYSPRTAALSVLYCAVSSEIEKRSTTGRLFVPVATQWPPHHPKAEDAAFGRALWETSQAIVQRALAVDLAEASAGVAREDRQAGPRR
uniref:Protochlorophyllide reductase n=1 Tax=Alexandrium monilatum TaxID=311494 RepID=A0A7S4R3L5_9DINO